MSNHNATTNDRSRIQWTPLMERYFVDLMLEQKRRGNRAGHTFKKEAWKEMQKMFSTKFAFECDKDSMKLYYANLWNKFNSVKNILCHKDFTWDDSTEMVVADDQVWDAYIQAYPNAQKYRIRPVLNYGDLCEIFDNTNADGRYSISSHDASIGVGMQELNLVAGDGEGGSTSQRIVWSAAMDQLFIKLLLQKLRENNGSINTNAWADMLTVFKANFGFQHGRHILRHRFTKYYKYFSEMSNILNTKGFSWDSQTQIITAHDHIWKAYIKEHRYARKYLENTFPNYDDLELLFRSMSEKEVRRLRQERNYNHGATQIEDGGGDGNPNPSDTNEGRIRWTLTMDHYFIDLLLEQMKFGNKVGNTYNPQAWNAIVKSFNERFKTHCGKENLRNHYKHFKRQFSVVSNILQLKEFTWDDTKEMVVAEDHVWDAYIKENHEARSVRTKGLHGYSKLCAILAEESSETRHSTSSQNIDHLNVETQILSTEAIEKEVEQLSYGFTFFDEENHDIQDIFSYLEMDEACTVEWTEAMEVYFIELMVEQVNININSWNNIGRSFSEEAWIHMTEAFSTRMGFQYHKHFLEEQFVCLMYRHQNMTDLLNSTGLASDQTLQITLATTQVWEAQLQNNQEAISSKLKSLRLFHDLCKIYGNKLTEGTASDIMQQLHIMDGANNISTRNSEISKHKKRANMMASSSEPDLVKKKKNKKMESFESALKALLELKDMDEDLVMEACDLLEDEKKAITFLALDVSMRKKWLLRKLRP